MAAPVTGLREVSFDVVLSLPPKYSGAPLEGVNEHFTKMLFKYDDALGGFPLTFSDVRFLDESAVIPDDAPMFTFRVGCKMLLFAPKPGERIVGVVNKVAQLHVGLLIYGFFNASIPHRLASDYVHQAKAWKLTSEATDARKKRKSVNPTHKEDMPMTIKAGTRLPFYFTGVQSAVGPVVTLSGSLDNPAAAPAAPPAEEAPLRPLVVPQGEEVDAADMQDDLLLPAGKHSTAPAKRGPRKGNKDAHPSHSAPAATATTSSRPGAIPLPIPTQPPTPGRKPKTAQGKRLFAKQHPGGEEAEAEEVPTPVATPARAAKGKKHAATSEPVPEEAAAEEAPQKPQKKARKQKETEEATATEEGDNEAPAKEKPAKTQTPKRTPKKKQE
ncbi:putative DNA-directed RNA polymerase I subunit RPA43 [Paratrimastix pyriformis]|uniref:DNA-directed RNA polymerase I subunit RPA43 n=1 Tax=Paratrimastix pyriformis TaxID=342808 RepID=A0ABQ8U8G3_9EUKA|nr:putative DNA-directed RNA polymerase I subunit RPA43 [Paratrimastix pyriformis]